ncbi:nucleotidyltransferase family protein [Aerococcus sp. L_4]
MKAILLGAGYATRLYPLTKYKAKPLLEVACKTITDHIVEKIVEVPEVDEIIIVTNNKFAHQFEEWVEQADYDMEFTVVNDGTLTNETRLGAIGDIQFVINQLQISDDLLVLAGDNLFEFSLSEFVDFANEKNSDALAMYEEDNLPQLQRSGVAEVQQSNQLIVGFEEKPKEPKSNLSVPVFYVLKSSTIPLIDRYLSEGYNPDAPGNFIPYLIENKDTYAYVFEGKRYDIGTLESYASVQKIFESK